MSEATSSPQGAPAGPELSTTQRLTGVLFSPAKTFESIARKPGKDWLVPLLILIVLIGIAVFTINPKLDVDSAVKETMKKIDANPNLSAEQKDQISKRIRGQMETMVTGPGRFVTPVFVLIPIFLVPLIYHGVAAAMGAATRYGTVLAGYAWAQMVLVVKSLIGFVVALPRSSIDLKDVETLVKSNLAAFMDRDAVSPALYALATKIDLFEIWGVVLCSIMLARTTRLSKKAATIAVVSLWLVWVLLNVGGAAIGGMFGG